MQQLEKTKRLHLRAGKRKPLQSPSNSQARGQQPKPEGTHALTMW